MPGEFGEEISQLGCYLMLTAHRINLKPAIDKAYQNRNLYVPPCVVIIIFKQLFVSMSTKQEDQSTKELNQFVQNLLKQMQERFEDMSGNIIGRIDEMGKRIDDIEKSIRDIMNDLGEDELQADARRVG